MSPKRRTPPATRKDDRHGKTAARKRVNRTTPASSSSSTETAEAAKTNTPRSTKLLIPSFEDAQARAQNSAAFQLFFAAKKFFVREIRAYIETQAACWHTVDCSRIYLEPASIPSVLHEFMRIQMSNDTAPIWNDILTWIHKAGGYTRHLMNERSPHQRWAPAHHMCSLHDLIFARMVSDDLVDWGVRSERGTTPLMEAVVFNYKSGPASEERVLAILERTPIDALTATHKDVTGFDALAGCMYHGYARAVREILRRAPQLALGRSAMAIDRHGAHVHMSIDPTSTEDDRRLAVASADRAMHIVVMLQTTEHMLLPFAALNSLRSLVQFPEDLLNLIHSYLTIIVSQPPPSLLVSSSSSLSSS
jgi:hypothetical protein